MSGQNAASDQNPAQQEENSYLYGLFAMILNIIITYLIIHSSMAIGTLRKYMGTNLVGQNIRNTKQRRKEENMKKHPIGAVV